MKFLQGGEFIEYVVCSYENYNDKVSESLKLRYIVAKNLKNFVPNAIKIRLCPISQKKTRMRISQYMNSNKLLMSNIRLNSSAYVKSYSRSLSITSFKFHFVKAL